MNNLLEIIKNISSILAVVGIFVEIVPVKFNPISSLLKWIGKNLNGDKVSYRENKYISTVDNNVWTPTEYGWELLEEKD